MKKIIMLLLIITLSLSGCSYNYEEELTIHEKIEAACELWEIDIYYDVSNTTFVVTQNPRTFCEEFDFKDRTCVIDNYTYHLDCVVAAR